MNSKRMTLEDIAKIANVTVRTVERWINPTQLKNKENFSTDMMSLEFSNETDQLRSNLLFKTIKEKIELAKKIKVSAEFNFEQVIFIIRLGGNNQLADILSTNAKYTKEIEANQTFIDQIPFIVKETIKALGPYLTQNSPKQIENKEELKPRDLFTHIIDNFTKETGHSFREGYMVVAGGLSNVQYKLYTKMSSLYQQYHDRKLVFDELDKLDEWDLIIDQAKKSLNYF